MKKTLVFGAGNFAAAIIQGMLKMGMHPSQITVAGRKGTDFSKVQPFGVRTVNELSEKEGDASISMFAVKPAHVDALVRNIQAAKNAFSGAVEGYLSGQVFSWVSGFDPEIIASALEIPKNKVVCATGDTSIAVGKSIIPYVCESPENVLESVTLLKRLGDARRKLDYNEVLEGVSLIGAGQALTFQSLKFISVASKLSLYELVQELHAIFVENPSHYTLGFLGWGISSDPEAGKAIVQHLSNKGKAIRRVFNYDEYEALVLSVQAFISTIHFLAQQKDLSPGVIDALIARVATKGGCTQDGLSLIKSREEVLSEAGLSAFFFGVDKRTKQFPLEIKKSLLAENQIKESLVRA